MDNEDRSARHKLDEHFKLMLERPQLFGMTAEQVQRQRDIAISVLDATLGLEAGQALDLGGILASLAAEDKRLMLTAMPLFTGKLGILEMRFAHSELGRLGAQEVRAVIEAGSGRARVRDLDLGTEDVSVEYVRAPTEGESQGSAQEAAQPIEVPRRG